MELDTQAWVFDSTLKVLVGLVLSLAWPILEHYISWKEQGDLDYEELTN